MRATQVLGPPRRSFHLRTAKKCGRRNQLSELNSSNPEIFSGPISHLNRVTQWLSMGTSKPSSRKRVRLRRPQQNCLHDTQCCKSKSTTPRRRPELKCEPEPSKKWLSSRARYNSSASRSRVGFGKQFAVRQRESSGQAESNYAGHKKFVVAYVACSDTSQLR